MIKKRRRNIRLDLVEFLSQEPVPIPKNEVIRDNIIKAWNIINNRGYKNIMCSISGGSDSDVMLDIIYKVDIDKKVRYVWFDTGLEYEATKRHLEYLEKRYGIKIERERAIKPIPVTCKEYGQPFLSKDISQYLERLQKKGFDFKDYSYEYMLENYGKHIAQWWCNKKENDRFNIERSMFLKEFLISNPPQFKISSKCCNYAKKDVSHKLIKEQNIDLMIIGVRKAEGGIRATKYTSCFSDNGSDCSHYRPLFWYSNQDKKEYEEYCGIVHSDCYKIYGFSRTGCCCCPYGWVHNMLFYELEKIKKYEPKLYKAVTNVFKDSYEYTRKYLQFRKEMKDKEKGRKKLF
jgi:3'-phosphoadenosine 5'-phosphosulfate sulfotransferase (PAPS reductase)/FAD synthetase